jgi:hypothetical protein
LAHRRSEARDRKSEVRSSEISFWRDANTSTRGPSRTGVACYSVVFKNIVDFHAEWKLPGLLYAENSFFSVRRFVALLELGELLLRVGDVRLVRTAELKELPLPTKV